jgi:acyl-CoA synthetase (AMP-forming)/AMP-acid ligase II
MYKVSTVSSKSFNLSQVFEAVAEANPDRQALVTAPRTLTYRELSDESRRFAHALAGRGLGCRVERSQLAGHESGQDHLAIYLYNGPEFLVGMLGAYGARVAPFNVNYRYVAEELRYILANSGAKAILVHDAFAPTLAEVLDGDELIVQVPDDSGNGLLPGAVRYDDFLAEGSTDPLPERSPDDLYILYTGGTTGMPKGVLWRQHDIFVAAMGGRPIGQAEAHASLESVVETSRVGGRRLLVLPPLMHGAAQWSVFTTLTGGSTAYFAADPVHLDPPAVWRMVEEEQILALQVVGDAMGRPLVEELERGGYDLSGLFALTSGGAALHASLKDRFLELVPHAVVIDGVGSSESGAQMFHTSSRGAAATGTFSPGPETAVVSEDLGRVLEPGHEGTGWLAQFGHVPLGYLGDEAKTAATFPVIGGVRFSIPGDRAILRADGIIELLGRDSVTINSGGEKIFVEEVERAIANHPAVYDVIVVGRPSERWGAEAVAVVQLAEGATVTDDELLAEAGKHVARYKLPKAIVRRAEIQRSPAGKADYRWAKEQAVGGLA